MVFSERIKTITYNEILPSIVDTVNQSNIFTARALSNPKPWRGTTVNQPIQIANSTTGGSFDGMDEFDTSATNNVRSMTWYVKGYEQSIVIPGIEQSVNETSNKGAVRLLGAKMDEAANSLADGVGNLLYGYGNGKDFDGLGLIVDDGTATSSYAGLSRAELPNINGHVTAAAAGKMTLDLVSKAFDDASAAGSSQESPDIAFTTSQIWSLFESLLHKNNSLQAHYDATAITGYNRVNGKTPRGTSVPAQSLKGAWGVDAISYRGKPVVADDKCPNGRFYWINEHYLEYRNLKGQDLNNYNNKNNMTEGTYSDIKDQVPSFLQMRDFMQPINQYGKIGWLVMLGNLIHRQPRRNSVITGIKSIA
jgi:hypothetical protein